MSLTVTTWNVQNLFRPAAGEAEALTHYRAKLKELARVLRARRARHRLEISL